MPEEVIKQGKAELKEYSYLDGPAVEAVTNTWARLLDVLRRFKIITRQINWETLRRQLGD